MAYDPLNPQHNRRLKEAAIQKGLDPRIVDSYINDKRSSAINVKAYESTGDIGNIPLEQRAETIYSAGQQGYQPPEPEPKPLSAEASKVSGVVTGGLSGLKDLRQAIDKNPFKEGIQPKRLALAGRRFGVTKIGTLTQDLSDRIGRLRSGGAINNDEEKRFLSLLPSPVDSPELMEYKLKRLEDEFSSVGKSMGILDEDKPSDPTLDLGTTEKKKYK